MAGQVGLPGSPPSVAVSQAKLGIRSLGPRPRIDLTDSYVHKIDAESSHVFEYGDPLSHGLRGSLNVDGELSFHVTANEGKRTTRGGGRDMFISLMRRIEHEGLEVKSIVGEWVGRIGTGQSSNLDQYVANLKKMNDEDAAKNTWTGCRVAEFAFTAVSITYPLAPNGADHEVEVRFERPISARADR